MHKIYKITLLTTLMITSCLASSPNNEPEDPKKAMRAKLEGVSEKTNILAMTTIIRCPGPLYDAALKHATLWKAQGCTLADVPAQAKLLADKESDQAMAEAYITMGEIVSDMFVLWDNGVTDFTPLRTKPAWLSKSVDSAPSTNPKDSPIFSEEFFNLPKATNGDKDSLTMVEMLTMRDLQDKSSNLTTAQLQAMAKKNPKTFTPHEIFMARTYLTGCPDDMFEQAVSVATLLRDKGYKAGRVFLFLKGLSDAGRISADNLAKFHFVFEQIFLLWETGHKELRLPPDSAGSQKADSKKAENKDANDKPAS